MTTVLQNLTIRTFDGGKGSPEEARAWLSKFLHIANLSRWNGNQRLEMFVDSLTNPAKYWYKQLPDDVKRDWTALQRVFHRKYCTDTVPPRLMYYKLTQKSDELASNYLYRLNAAALRAGINFRDKYNPEYLDDHIQQFFDTLHDKALQAQFRFTVFDTIEELERKLSMYESAQGRPTRKTPAKKAVDDDVHPAVNKIDHNQRSYPDQRVPETRGAGSTECAQATAASQV
ncbi:hypothetical protein P43SY_011266 [Pythium insidiosum]|uniref:Retrotransposon gag domain-containing protein n=1 Tax=Pythium insidiosum TaxID=114742 RepID=A0AAD5LRW8_PYTIN|nr:hypothetical protein P43SY_011266 [Pythium insidiosum]